ncbi:hypothetical protein [Paracoccus aerodenitrificans]|uniref:hypothetical protein n=1 Tax=Paracoccus aerodenitrificans TaxID=3017781 RepID=UPI0022EFF60A|nr:hypothetical protein [Paracoccus aerodenitrificans]WBU62860.1 hypothetical protein PAE61_10820 [Paracoccus aerodenitrificans]
MIVIVCILAGLWLGWQRAGKSGGDRKDRWQWALAHALIFAIAGVFATIIIDRMI